LINSYETCNGEGKYYLVTGHEGPEEQKYNSTIIQSVPRVKVTTSGECSLC